MQLTLASTSPAREKVLNAAGVFPRKVSPGVDEEPAVAELVNPTPAQYVQHLATAKARAVDGKLVLGGDSMLLIDGELQGKPHTREETVRRWRQQRGKRAELVTGHALFDAATGQIYEEAVATQIQFADVSDRAIEAYAATGEPLECAGAFTLEALGGWFIESIDGHPSAVIGLSLPALRRGLAHFGYDFCDLWG